jgi:hypothetical protein
MDGARIDALTRRATRAPHPVRHRSRHQQRVLRSSDPVSVAGLTATRPSPAGVRTVGRYRMRDGNPTMAVHRQRSRGTGVLVVGAGGPALPGA